MATIGDLIMRVIANMKGFDTTVTKQATKTGEKAGKNLSRGMSKGLGSSAKTGILQGLGLGAGLGAIGLVSSAISTLTGLVGDSIKAFNEDQVSQQKLGTVLRANLPLWDGTTDAIEETIASRMKLGFSDDEQRESLARLVAATHDQNKALEMQRTAMDLARFAGTSLAQASQDLVKVSAGQFRILKKLGIQLPKNATALEALATIQKVVTGGAEDYAATNEGKVLVSQIRINEVMERFGAVMAGPVADGVTLVADAVEQLVPLLADLTSEDGVGAFRTSDPQSGPGKFFQDFGDAILDVVDTATAWDEYESQAEGRRRRRLEALAAASRVNFGEMHNDLVTVGDGFVDLGDDAEKGTGRVRRSVKEMVDELNDAADDLINNFFDPIHAEENRHDARLALFAAQEALRNAKTRRDAKDAKRDIVSALEDQAQALQKLGTQGKLSQTDIDKFAKDAKAAYADLGKKVPKALQKIIVKLREVASFDANIRIDVATRKLDNATGTKPRASGGPVSAGSLYRINERGTEYFRPSVNGQVIPIAPGGQGGSAGAPNINVQMNGLPRASDPFAVARQLRRLSEMGQLTPRDKYG